MKFQNVKGPIQYIKTRVQFSIFWNFIGIHLKYF